MTRRHIIIAAALIVACAPPDSSTAAAPDIALTRPDPAALAAHAPDSFTVVLTTSQGEVEVRIRRAWAPLGADRVHYLASHGFFNGARFFRVLPGFIAQFGMSGIPAVDSAFDKLAFADDSVRTGNKRGTLTFATAGPNTRTTQLFINLADNAQLDATGFAPVGEVVRGMEVVERLYSGYGEGVPYGSGPDQTRISSEGNRYLRQAFPRLDSIVSVSVRP
jgi:peptidyl-prolyl cis-trans isomerase A (cyclophilin A)